MKSRFLLDAILEAARPRSVEPISVWASKHFRVERSSQFKGNFNPAVAPWANAPLDALGNKRTRTVCVCCSAQSSKTTIGMVFAAHSPAESPGDMMLVINSVKQARRLMKQRLLPILRQCKPAWKHIPSDDREAVQLCEISFDNMFFAATGAESLGELQSYPFTKLWLEEVRNWQNRESLPVVLKRTTAFWNCKVFVASCPGLTIDPMAEMFASGTQKHATVALPCRSRGAQCRQEMMFEAFHENADGSQERRGMIWKKNDSTYDADRDDYRWTELYKTIRYKCRVCGEEFQDSVEFRRRLAQTVEYEQRNPHATAENESFTWNALIVWWIRWRALVNEFLRAKRQAQLGAVEPLKDFINERLAQPFEDRAVWADSKKRITLGDYRKSDPAPEDYKFRFAAIDVQLDHCWMVCVAMKPTCETRILFEGKVKGSLADCHEIQKRFSIAGCSTGIDVAYQRRAVEVRNASARYGWNTFEETAQSYFHWRLTDGAGAPAVGQDGRPLFVKRIYSQPILVALPNALTTRNDQNQVVQVQAVPMIRWAKSPTFDIVQVWKTGNPPHVPPLISPPQDVSADWLAHMGAMVKALRTNPRTSRRSWEWVETKDRFDLWICHAIIAVIASIAGLVAIDTQDPSAAASGAQPPAGGENRTANES